MNVYGELCFNNLADQAVPLSSLMRMRVSRCACVISCQNVMSVFDLLQACAFFFSLRVKSNQHSWCPALSTRHVHTGQTNWYSRSANARILRHQHEGTAPMAVQFVASWATILAFPWTISLRCSVLMGDFCLKRTNLQLAKRHRPHSVLVFSVGFWWP